MKRIILPIKKIYFDRILSREKTIEYREYKPYFQKVFSEKVDCIEFHYYQGKRLLVEVERIEIINNILESDIITTEKLYAIHLGEIIGTKGIEK